MNQIKVLLRNLCHSHAALLGAAMGLAAAIRQWHSRRVQTYELGCLGRDQREALARDIGLSHDVLETLMEQGPDAAAELPLLMHALGLAPETTYDTHPAVLLDMSIVCSGCL